MGSKAVQRLSADEKSRVMQGRQPVFPGVTTAKPRAKLQALSKQGKRIAFLDEIFLGLLQFLGELLLYILLDLFAFAVGDVLKGPWRKEGSESPGIVLFGYCLYGGAVGGLSLLIRPEHFLHPFWARVITLLLAPVIAGLVMLFLARRFRRRIMVENNRMIFSTALRLRSPWPWCEPSGRIENKKARDRGLFLTGARRESAARDQGFG